VQAAAAYYADNRAEIDEWIDSNRRVMDEAASAVLRRQAIKGK
jgi:hypothetical protein